MPRHRLTAAAPRDRVFWIAASVLVVGQLVAFWTLCSDQVRRAEVRHASVQVERVAVADCLRSMPNATIRSCAARVAPDSQLAAAQPVRDESAIPVNYVYH